MIQKQPLLLAFIITQSINVVASARDGEMIHMIDPIAQTTDYSTQITEYMLCDIQKMCKTLPNPSVAPIEDPMLFPIDHYIKCVDSYYKIPRYVNPYTISAFIALVTDLSVLANLPPSSTRDKDSSNILASLCDKKWDKNLRCKTTLKEESTAEQSALYTELYRTDLIIQALLFLRQDTQAVDDYSRRIFQIANELDSNILTAEGTSKVTDIVNRTTHTLGLMHAISEQYGTAHQLFEKSLKAGYTQSGSEIARLFLRQGNLDGAFDYTKRYEENFAEKMNTIGFILECKGHALDAAIHYNKAAVHGHVYAQLNLVYLYEFYPDLVKEIVGTAQLQGYATRAIDSRDPEIATIQYYSTHWPERYTVLASQQLIDDILSQCDQPPTKDFLQEVTDAEDDTEEEYDPTDEFIAGPDKGKGKAVDDTSSPCEQPPTKDRLQDDTDSEDITHSEDDTDEEYDPAAVYASGPDKGKGKAVDDALFPCEEPSTKDLLQDGTDSEDDTDEEYDPAAAYASGPDKGKGKAEE